MWRCVGGGCSERVWRDGKKSGSGSPNPQPRGDSSPVRLLPNPRGASALLPGPPPCGSTLFLSLSLPAAETLGPALGPEPGSALRLRALPLAPAGRAAPRVRFLRGLLRGVSLVTPQPSVGTMAEGASGNLSPSERCEPMAPRLWATKGRRCFVAGFRHCSPPPFLFSALPLKNICSSDSFPRPLVPGLASLSAPKPVLTRIYVLLDMEAEKSGSAWGSRFPRPWPGW